MIGGVLFLVVAVLFFDPRLLDGDRLERWFGGTDPVLPGGLHWAMTPNHFEAHHAYALDDHPETDAFVLSGLSEHLGHEGETIAHFAENEDGTLSGITWVSKPLPADELTTPFNNVHSALVRLHGVPQTSTDGSPAQDCAQGRLPPECVDALAAHWQGATGDVARIFVKRCGDAGLVAVRWAEAEHHADVEVPCPNGANSGRL